MDRRRLFFLFFIFTVSVFLLECRICHGRPVSKLEMNEAAIGVLHVHHSGDLQALASILPRGRVPPSGPVSGGN
ncbi:hypothetical protein KFK09_009877 [Dendrobium nobile]|uniref:Uncharacterized protein n=1 Tax=Dendrobium nobile TaxID=94219 RepID=A0A8T3BNV3_DENNO|nr:hypothetical protein KFK09_009877 [Dendrobium nobile]